MKTIFTLIFASLLTLAATAPAQTIKSLGYNTNGEVVYSGTNALTFTNDVQFETVIANGIFAGTNAATDLVLDTQNWALYANTNIIASWDNNFFLINVPVQFNNTTNAAATRTNLGVAPAPIFKVLTNDFSITNQTNMTVVDGLTIATEAGKAYIFELFPIVSADFASTPVQIVASNATVYGNWDSLGAGSFGLTALTNVFNFNITTTRVPVQKFYVIAGTSAGSISFQFSSTAETNVNTIGAGSYMKAQEVVPTP